jgi:predicted Fe-Mo cluster-binding NifX family protein
MKIAIPSSNKFKVAEHFGRAQLFAVFNSENKSFEYMDNKTNLNAAQGAGIQSATSLVNKGVEIILSPRIGPKAFDVLKSANIKMYLISGSDSTVERALALYNKGELELLESSNK